MIPVSQRQALLSSSVLLDNGVKKGWMLRGQGTVRGYSLWRRWNEVMGSSRLRWGAVGQVWSADSGLGCQVRVGLFLSHSDCEP